MDAKTYLNELHRELLSMIELEKPLAIEQAAQLFPDHPYAREVWVKLHTEDGGIEETVNTLGLHREFELYLERFNEFCLKQNYEAAAMAVNDFSEFCKEQVKENFYMFKNT